MLALRHIVLGWAVLHSVDGKHSAGSIGTLLPMLVMEVPCGAWQSNNTGTVVMHTCYHALPKFIFVTGL